MSARNDVDRVIAEARRLGFEVGRSKCEHLKFTRHGVPAVFFSCTPGDRRAWKNGVAKLRRAAAAAERAGECR